MNSYLDRTLLAVGRRLLPQLAWLAQHRDPEVRAKSLSVLSKVGGDKANDLLTAGLADPAPLGLRQVAMQGAARLANASPGTSEALGAIVMSRLQAISWQERVAAAQALAAWPPGRRTSLHQEVLLEALLSDQKGFVRAAAATSLGRILLPGPVKSARVCSGVAQAASHQTEPISSVRFEAVRVLQNCVDPKARATLDAIIRDDPSKRVRDAASQI